MKKTLQSGWLTALLGSIVYCGTTAAVMMSANIPIAHPETKEVPVEFGTRGIFTILRWTCSSPNSRRRRML